MTPGRIRTSDAAQICAKSFRTKPFRKTTAKIKREVCQHYQVKAQCPGPTMEIDHLVPLELGGEDASENLWPQFYEPTPGAHQKDLVENELKRRVCSGKMSLGEAQAMLMADWYEAYRKLGFGK